jgi:hypothetical protein
MGRFGLYLEGIFPAVAGVSSKGFPMAASVEKVPVVCPNCNKRLLVPAGTLGKQGRCPACQTVFTLEQLWEAEPVQPATPQYAPQLAPLSPFGAPAAAANPFAPAAPNAWGAPSQPAANPFGNSAPAANAWGSPAAPAAANSPYADDDFQGDYQLQAAPPVPQSNYAAPSFTPVSTSYSGSYSKPRKERTWDSSVLGGIAMMVIAIVWFVGGLAINIIFIYPPILFIIGLIAFIKGMFAGNLAGD